MTMLKLLGFVLVPTILAGCSKGPEPGTVQNDNADPWAGDWMARGRSQRT